MHRYGIIAVAFFLAFSFVPVEAKSGEKSHLEVSDIEFGPIQQEGKSTVRMKVENTSDRDQTFVIDIRAESPRSTWNWQRQFDDTIRAGETKWTIFDLRIPEPVTDKSFVRLRFYNPPSRHELDVSNWFREERYYGKNLQPGAVVPERPMPVSKRQAEAVTAAFEEFRNGLRDGKPKQAWDIMSKAFQDKGAEGDFERFKAEVAADEGFITEVGNLRPQSITRSRDLLVLQATHNGVLFSFGFIEDDGRWKIAAVKRQTGDWQARLLPTMEKRVTEHFDIYFFKDSTTAKEIDRIAEQRDKGYRETCRFLGRDSDVRIRLIFFEDAKRKQRETGHQGAGWAVGTTIVEVYNEKEKLNPYHEAVHILMGPYGSPPAAFNEGFAVYMSERLGAPALSAMGGGQLSVYRRARELKENNEWIPLEELLTYTEIGSKESRPLVAYPEAASFVKFLIETYGKDKFLRAYKDLQNSSIEDVQEHNKDTLEKIYGKPLRELEKEWEKAFSNSPQ